MKKNNILTNEELDMLLCISDTALHDQSDNFNYLQIANERLLVTVHQQAVDSLLQRTMTIQFRIIIYIQAVLIADLVNCSAF